MIEDFDDIGRGASEREIYQKSDSYFLAVSNEIQEFYKQDPNAVFYMKQLQVKFEKKYFHWITHNAVIGLAKNQFLKQINITVESSGNNLKLHFFAHVSNRYPKRAANALAKIVAEYSQDHIMRSCGNRAEILFAEALSARGFTIHSRNAKSYKRRKWIKTDHNLDYIFEKDKIAYGCEIKNKLGYIDKDELEAKLAICKHLRLKPLFIMRASPANYNYMIIKAGGFALIFEAQIFDLSQKTLVEKIRDNLGYIVDCPRVIPDGIIDRFEKWHERTK